MNTSVQNDIQIKKTHAEVSVIDSPLPFLSETGMHYLHMEAPIRVIHRDLKSRNGNV